MNISNEDIGKRIRALRESRNMTIQNLADEILCDYDHLQKAEKGKRGLGLDTLVLICRKFEISMDELLCGEPPADTGISSFLADIEMIYKASKRLYDSANYAERFGVLRRIDTPDTGISCNQQSEEERRIPVNKKIEGCIGSLKNEYDSSDK